MKDFITSNDAKYYFAVDLGGTTAKCAIINKNNIIKKFIVATKLGSVIENIRDNFLKEIEEIDLKIDDFEFLAFTICGLIDYEKGVSIWSGNLQWENYPVVEEISKCFKHKNVFILNDSKAATYGEYIYGVKKEKPNVLFYTIGTGVGGGVILNYDLFFGNNTKLASEPGHTGGFQDSYQCNCGLPGCVEGLSSATGIEKELNKNIKYFQSKLGKQLEKVTIKDISNLVFEKDEKTIEILEFTLLPLVKHIAVSLHLLDFDIVIIGGGPSALNESLIIILKKMLKNYLLPNFYQKLDLRTAVLKNDAGIWGVYQYALNKFSLKEK